MKPYKGTITVRGSISPLIELGAGFDPRYDSPGKYLSERRGAWSFQKFMAEHFDEIVEFAGIENFWIPPSRTFLPV
ncbi:MAG: hypothetical protein ACLR6B_15970 [Blautia sp.]